MKKITLHNYVLFLLVIVFASCNNEENVMPKTEVVNSNFEKIVLEEGIIAFESMDDFSEFLKNANTKDEFLVEFEKQFSGFKSNFDAYEAIEESQVEEMLSNPEKYSAFAKIVEDNGEKYLEPNVDDVNIRSVVNESGIVKIGKKYYKFTYERVFISEKLSDLENNTTGRLSNVETIEVIRGSGEYLRMPNQDCRRDYTKRVKISNWPRIYRNIDCRFRGRLWTVNIGSIYSGIGANSTHYVKTAGIWFRDKAPMLRLEYDVDYIQYFPTAGNIYLTESFDSGEKIDTRRIDETFQFCVNASCNFSFESADSYHSGRGDAGNTWGCNLNI